MEEAPENGAGVSAASETRAVAKYAAPDQKNLSRAFTLTLLHLTSPAWMLRLTPAGNKDCQRGVLVGGYPRLQLLLGLLLPKPADGGPGNFNAHQH